jgi:hypothetical protein
MNISRYVPQGSDLAGEHKDSPYFPRPVDVHKLCTSVFKLMNIFLYMNIGLEEHKKSREMNAFFL